MKGKVKRLQFPVFAMDVKGTDYYMILSEFSGKFIRNFRNEASYCYMSCNCTEGEVAQVLKQLGGDMVVIDEVQYMAAVAKLLTKTVETLGFLNKKTQDENAQTNDAEAERV